MPHNFVLLNNVEHQNLKVKTGHSAEFGDNVQYAQTFPLEFRQVQSCYPIFLRKDAVTGDFSPIALFGFQERENLFLSDSGWEADYIPLMIRRHPFVIGLQSVEGGGDEKRSVVSLDMNNPRVSETEGEALFLEHGGTSDFLTNAAEMLETIRLADEMGKRFVAALVEHDLIESVTMQIELKDGSKHELLGFYTIHEEKLHNLDDESLGKLHRDRFIESIYMMLASMTCFRDLVAKKNDQLVSSD